VKILGEKDVFVDMLSEEWIKWNKCINRTSTLKEMHGQVKSNWCFSSGVLLDVPIEST
jgi:hypothetical protein